jgi:hypothetical protein
MRKNISKCDEVHTLLIWCLSPRGPRHREGGHTSEGGKRGRRGLAPRPQAEMSLHVLAYNVKRMIAIFGVAWLLQAIRA